MKRRTSKPRRPKSRRARPRIPRKRRRRPRPPDYFEATQRPLACLLFLLPWLVLYEIGTFLIHPDVAIGGQHRVVSFTLLEQFFALFGWSSFYLPGLAVVVILLAWHVAANDPWSASGRTVLGMTAESVGLAIPLLILGRALQLAAGGSAVPGWADRLVLSVGAGIYEELLFRLMVISALSFVLIDLLRLPKNAALICIIMISSGAFAAHHYAPFGSDAFGLVSFLFRTAAGIYLAGVFVYRGFGLAAGCHIVYDIAVVSLDVAHS